MSSRFSQRGPNLFSAYDATQAATTTNNNNSHRTNSASPSLRPSASTPQNVRTQRSGPYAASSSSPYSLSNTDVRHTNTSAGAAYPGVGGGEQSDSSGVGGFRSATPNKKGQYSDAVLNELESQNDEQLEGMSAKVKMLKDITTAIGAEIRDSTSLADTMNDGFENTRVKLRGTMNRMLRMAERTGVGWRVWVGFFAAVILLFWYVWVR